MSILQVNLLGVPQLRRVQDPEPRVIVRASTAPPPAS